MKVHLYRFVNHGGHQFVMTQADVSKCTDPMECVKRHCGKPLDTGRLVAIRFSTKDRPQEQFIIFALIMDTELRKKADWLKASSGASVKDKRFGNTLYKCNPKEFELAVLLESLVQIFAAKPWRWCGDNSMGCFYGLSRMLCSRRILKYRICFPLDLVDLPENWQRWRIPLPVEWCADLVSRLKTQRQQSCHPILKVTLWGFWVYCLEDSWPRGMFLWTFHMTRGFAR